MKRWTALLLAVFLLALSVPAASGASLAIEVTYDAPIRCGVPTTFTMTGKNGSGSYKYYVNSIDLYAENAWDYVVDPSYMSGFSTVNTYDFTFYASGNYRIKFWVMDTQSYTSTSTLLYLTVDDADYPSTEDKADAVAAECLKVCRTDYDKALWLHDWLVDNMCYDYSYLYCGCEGALCRGKGTCSSYHGAYCMLLRRVGLTCGQSIGNGHIWTAVKMDGKWYQVDVTWDDNGYGFRSYLDYIYFGLTDELMQAAHDQHTINTEQRSDSLENNYFIKSGKVSQWADPLAAKIQTELNKGQRSFTVATVDSTARSLRDIYMGITVWALNRRIWTSGGEDYTLTVSYEPPDGVTEADNQFHVTAVKLTDLSIADGQWRIRNSVLTTPATLVIARYTKGGKLLCADTVAVTKGEGEFTRGELTLTAGEQVRLFLLDKDNLPLCESQTSE